MNIFHLNSRNLRVLTNLLGLLVCVFFGVLALRGFSRFSDGYSSRDEADQQRDVKNPSNEDDSIFGRLKFGTPDADGKVEVVIAIDANDAGRYLEKKFRKFNVVKYVPPIPVPNVTLSLNNPHICSTAVQLKYIVSVSSKPEAQTSRDALRQTWANPKLFKGDVSRLIFLVGKPSTDPDGSLQAQIVSEFELNGDIIQGNFLDTLGNSTLKGVMGLQWVTTYCSNAAFTVKASDESFVDIFALTRLMDRNKFRWSMMCPLWKENTMPILRDPKVCGGWCVQESDFPGQTHFPQYCASVLIVMSHDLVADLTRAAARTPFFWIGDVYVTGLLPKKLPKSIHYIDLLGSMSFNWNVVSKQYFNSTSTPTVMITYLTDVLKLRKLWKAVLSRQPTSVIKLLSDSVIAQLG